VIAIIGTRGIAPGGRGPRISALQAELQRLELEEEALIEAARVDGVTIGRLGVPSPMALLQITFPPLPMPMAVAAE
jgi:hypothetical protein